MTLKMPPVSRKKRGVLAPLEEQAKKRSCTSKRKNLKDECSDEKMYTKVSKENESGVQCPSTSFKVKSSGVSLSPRKKFKRQNKLESEIMKDQSAPVNNIDSMNVEQLLALGEKSQVVDFVNEKMHASFEDSSDSEMSDLEEVKDTKLNEPVIPKEGVNVTLDIPNLFQKRKRKSLDVETHLKRQLNRVKKDIQLLMHKVHLLCWIAHMKFVNNTLNTSCLMESCMTSVKSMNLYPPKYADLAYLEGILKWFSKNFELRNGFEDPRCTGGLLKELSYEFDVKKAFSYRHFTFMFIILLRVVGLKARIVMSFQVLPVRPSTSELYEKISAQNIKSEISKKSEAESNNLNNGEQKIKKEQESMDVSVKNNEETVLRHSIQRKADIKRKAISDYNSSEAKIKKGKEGKKQGNSNLKANTNAQKIKKCKTVTDNSDDDFESKHFKVSPSLTKGKAKTKSKQNGETGFQLKASDKTRLSRKSKTLEIKEVRKNVGTVKADESNNSDEDFTPSSLKKKGSLKQTDRKSVKTNKESKESLESKKKEGCDLWAEVYLEAEGKWISVDIPRQKIHCVSELYSRATHPVVYVLACNNEFTLKDVTKRYVPNWHSETRKRRVDEEWWNDTLSPYLPPSSAQDREEDEDINRQISDKPLPSVISEYKDHPLYALKRHLLKFEGIYPPDAPTLGFVRGEPVYARECVVTLRSREMWYKEARLVRLKETPYKVVKARPKFDKMSGEIKKDLPLELYGIWQTEDFIPPIAVDGKVPRNEYGNVDLFKPCMLPKGTVHLQIPALNRVAKKLGIDCVPATVGFDFHSGGSHPIFDGFVVCEEFKDVLLDAWNKEIDQSAKKNEEKKEKRVYGNWKRLIRGLLIKEKLKIKYAFGENSDEEDISTASTANTSCSLPPKN